MGKSPTDCGGRKPRSGRSAWCRRWVKGVKGGKWFSLMDKVVRPSALDMAWRRVARNKGAAGVDGQSMERFAAFFMRNGICRSFRRSSRERDLPAQPGETGRDTQGGRQTQAAGHPDVAGIMHLMQRAFGVMGVDVLNWRPKFEGTGQICRQSILRMVRLACAGAQRQDHGRSNSERPKG